MCFQIEIECWQTSSWSDGSRCERSNCFISIAFTSGTSSSEGFKRWVCFQIERYCTWGALEPQKKYQTTKQKIRLCMNNSSLFQFSMSDPNDAMSGPNRLSFYERVMMVYQSVCEKGTSKSSARLRCLHLVKLSRPMIRMAHVTKSFNDLQDTHLIC